MDAPSYEMLAKIRQKTFLDRVFLKILSYREIREFVEFSLNFGVSTTDFRNLDLIAFKWDGYDGTPF